MLNFLIQGLILGVSFFVIFIIIEIARMVTGKEILIDKMISYLQILYRRSAPIENNELDWLVSDLPFKGRVIVLHSEVEEKEKKLLSK